MTQRDHRLDPGELLSIDVEAELAKLGGAQLEGPWQLAVEIVRRALAAGARQVDVEVTAERCAVVDDGRPPDAKTLARLAEALDISRPTSQRHAALVALEDERMGLFATLPSLGCQELTVVGAGARLHWRRSSGTTTIEPALEQRGRVSFRLPLAAPQVRQALLRACRFAPAVVKVDGAVVPVGFANVIGDERLAAPLEGRVALGRTLGDARVWLLLGGVVVTRVVTPALPPVEVALEVGPHARNWSPVGAREALADQETALADQALGFLLTLGHSIARQAEADQRRVRRALLETARRRLGRSEILRLPLLRRRSAALEEWLSLADLGRERPPLLALPPGRALEDHLCPGPALVLASDERALLGELVGLTFITPPLRRDAHLDLGTRLRVLRAGLTRRIGTLFHPRRGEPLRSSALSPGERALMLSTRASLGHLVDDVLVFEGRAPWAIERRHGRRVLLLARDHPRVAAASRLAATDPAWSYPGLTAILAGSDLPGSQAAQAWRRREGSRARSQSDG